MSQRLADRRFGACGSGCRGGRQRAGSSGEPGLWFGGDSASRVGAGFCGPGTCPPDGRIPLILTPCSSRCGTRSRSFPRRQRGSVVQCFFWGSSSGAMRLALRTCSGRQLRPATAWVSCSPETGMLIFPRKRGTFPEAPRQGSFGRHFAALPTVSRLSICSQNRF